jgi:Fe-S cluster assembly protein SufD
MLSDQAKAESIPSLEILADDVRCSHGVSIGELDPTEVFYLMSRGMSAEITNRLLLEGFLEPILDRISSEKIRNRVRFAIEAKIETIKH